MLLLFSLLITTAIVVVDGGLIVATSDPNQASRKGYVTEGQFRYMAALFRGRYLICGATVIAEYYLVTAAHCLANKYSSELNVAVGVLDANNYNGVRYYLKRYYIHPDYYQPIGRADVGVIELKDPIDLINGYAKSLKISNFIGDYHVNTTAVFSGYAQNITGPYEYGRLKWSILRIWDRDVCNCFIKPKLEKDMICVGEYTGGIGICLGDSGSPLFVHNRLYAMPAITFGCSTKVPALFLIVAYYRSWIMGIAGLKD